MDDLEIKNKAYSLKNKYDIITENINFVVHLEDSFKQKYLIKYNFNTDTYKKLRLK